MENIDEIEEDVKMIPPVGLSKHFTQNNKVQVEFNNFEMPIRTKSLTIIEEDLFLSV